MLTNLPVPYDFCDVNILQESRAGGGAGSIQAAGLSVPRPGGLPRQGRLQAGHGCKLLIVQICGCGYEYWYIAGEPGPQQQDLLLHEDPGWQLKL